MSFDPDAYLKDVGASFDPDSYLKEKGIGVPSEGVGRFVASTAATVAKDAARRNIADPGIAAVKGLIGVPETMVGLADLAVVGGQPPMGASKAGMVAARRPGEAPEKFNNSQDYGIVGRVVQSTGLDFRKAKLILDSMLSPEQQADERYFQESVGFFNKVKAAIERPSIITQGAIESAPTMLTGAALSRTVMAVAPKTAPLIAAAIGEALVTAGQNLESIRQESEGGKVSLKQVGITGLSGAATGLLGYLGGRAAKWLGIADVDVLIGTGTRAAGKKHVARRVVEGMLSEGVLEELPQSTQEQIAQNLALGKPWDDGVADAAAQGMLAGAAMGGAANVFGGNPDSLSEWAKKNPDAAKKLAEMEAPSRKDFDKAGLPRASAAERAAVAEVLRSETKVSLSDSSLSLDDGRVFSPGSTVPAGTYQIEGNTVTLTEPEKAENVRAEIYGTEKSTTVEAPKPPPLPAPLTVDGKEMKPGETVTAGQHEIDGKTVLMQKDTPVKDVQAMMAEPAAEPVSSPAPAAESPATPTAEGRAAELMTPEEFRRGEEVQTAARNVQGARNPENKLLVLKSGQRNALKNAYEARRPVNAEAADAYAAGLDGSRPLPMPPGYVREGDRYVFKSFPTAPTTPPQLDGAAAQAAQEPGEPTVEKNKGLKAPPAAAKQDFPARARAIIESEDSAALKNGSMARLAKEEGITEKEAQERVESVVVEIGREIALDPKSDARQKFDKLVDLYNRQPRFSKRSSVSIRNQAYSTPLPLAFAASIMADVTPGSTTYDPTAGHGALTIAAEPGNVSVNEIDPERLASLKRQGYGTITENDANAWAPAPKSVDRVVINPPFGTLETTEVIDGYHIKKLEQSIAIKALEAMKDEGKASIIVGASMMESDTGAGERNFLNFLMNKYNVVGNFEIDGDLYSKQGASFPVRVIAIDGRKAVSKMEDVAPKRVKRLKSWDEVYEAISEVQNETAKRGSDLESKGTRADPDGDTQGKAGTEDDGRVSGPSGDDAESSGAGGKGKRRRPKVGGAHARRNAGRGGRGSPAGTDVQQPGPSGETDRGDTSDSDGKRDGSDGGRDTAGSDAGVDGRGGSAGPGGVDSADVESIKGKDAADLTDADIDALIAAEEAKQAKAKSPAPAPAPKPAPQPSPAPKIGRKGVTKAPRTGRAIAKSAASNAVSALDEAAAGLAEIFGNGTRMNMGVSVDFDPKTYARAKPHFEKAWAHMKASGKDVSDFVRWVMGLGLPGKVGLYVKQFRDDLAAARKAEQDKPAPDNNWSKVNDRQDNYGGKSRSKKIGTLVNHFLAPNIRAALDKLAGEVGDIDVWVAGKLGYASVEEMHVGLAGEQVDGVALAISRIEAGGAMIFGDQTGIGKGRQAASLIRYAQQQGYIPIFVTADPKLFSDMYGDLIDIGSTVKPLLMGDPGKVSITNTKDNSVIVQSSSAAKQKSMIADILEGGTLEDAGFDSIFMTYSQVSSLNGTQLGPRQQFIQNLARDGKVLFILDESHKGSGDSTTGVFLRGGKMEVKVGGRTVKVTLPGALRQSGVKGVAYLSATYAKRPDSMPLYFATSLGRAVKDVSKLPGLFAQGGIALQQAVAEALAKAGEYIRRESNFAGVSFKSKMAITDPESVAKTVQNVDEVARVLREIVRYSADFVKAVGKMKDRVKGNANTQSALGTSDFTSSMHNYVSQMLLAAKAESAAAEAIEAHKRGEKVVIALSNTMGSFIEEYATDNDMKDGDEIAITFADILQRALDRTMSVTQTDPGGGKTKFYLKPSDVGLQAEYDVIVSMIDELSDSLHASPIDYIAKLMRDAGMTVDEITGRKHRIEYTDDGRSLYRVRSDKEVNDKNAHVNRFNREQTDALIINQAGSTGISLHASSKNAEFNPKPRHMIVAQADLNIDTFTQVLGRILRTGMIGEASKYAQYTLLSLPLEVERRPNAVLAFKMKSLNANTTADTSSDTSVDSLDFLNEYGDIVAAQIINEDSEVADYTNLSVSLDADGELDPPKGLAKQLTGRIAVLDNSKQKEVYTLLAQRYARLVEELKENGTYDIEMTVQHGWKAQLVAESVMVRGTDKSSMFTDDLTIGDYSIIDQRKPPTPDDLRAAIQRTQGTSDMDAASEKMRGKLKEMLETARAKYADYIKEPNTTGFAEDLKKKVLASWEARVAIANRGAAEVERLAADVDDMLRKRVRLLHNPKFNTEMLGGFIVDITHEHSSKKGNPMRPSLFVVDVMVESRSRKIKVPFSKLIGNLPWVLETDLSKSSRVEDFAKDVDRSERTTRKIMTGNLVRGIEMASKDGNRPGQITSFSMEDGTIVTGLVLTDSFRIEDLGDVDPRKHLKSGAALLRFLDASLDRRVTGTGGVVTISKPRGQYGNYIVTSPIAKSKGGDIYGDKKIEDIVGVWHSSGRVMSVIVDSDDGAKIERLANYLIKTRQLDLTGYGADTAAIADANGEAPLPTGVGAAAASNQDFYGDAVGTKHAYTDAMRERLGFDERTPTETRADEELEETAAEMYAANPSVGRDMIAEFAADPDKAPTDLQSVIFLHEMVDAESELNAANASGNEDRANRANVLLDSLYGIVERAGTAAGRALRARRFMMTADYNIARMEWKAKKANGGKALTKDGKAEIARQHAIIVANQKQMEADAERLKAVESEVEAVKAQAQAEVRWAENLAKALTSQPGRKSPFLKKMNSWADETEARVMARIKARVGRASSIGADPTVLLDMGELGAVYLVRGIIKFSEWSAKMRSAFADATDEDLRKARELADSQVADQAAVANEERRTEARAKRAKSKVRNVTKEIKALFREEAEAGVTDLDEAIANVHDIISEDLPDITPERVRDEFSDYGRDFNTNRNEVDKVIAQMRREAQLVAAMADVANDIAPKLSAPPREKPSQKNRELARKLRADMKAHKITTTDKAKQRASALDAVKSRLKNAIDDIEKALAPGGTRITADRSGVEYDAEAKSLKDRLALLREQYDELFPKKPLTDEQRLAIAIKQAERTADQWAQRVKDAGSGKFGPAMADGASRPWSVTLAEIRAKTEEAKAEVARLREIANPKKTPEQAAIDAKRKRIDSAIKELQRRVREKDFAPKPKGKTVDISKDPEAMKSAIAYALAKLNFDRLLHEYKRANMTKAEKALDGAIALMDAQRNVLASYDVSAVGRQGWYLALAHPVLGLRATAAMSLAMTQGRSAQIAQSLRERKNWHLYKKYDLVTDDDGTGNFSHIEDRFKLNVVGMIPGINMSNRAYATFLNVLRADVFDQMLANSRDPSDVSDAKIKAIALGINTLSGKGELRFLGRKVDAETAAHFFWAPRFFMSSLDILTFRPLRTGPAESRIAFAKTYARAAVSTAILYTLVSMFRGGDDDDDGEIEWDPRSSDFGAVPFSNHRVGLLGFVRPLLTFIARTVSGQSKVGGEIVNLRESFLPFASDTERMQPVPYGTGMMSVISRFVQSKAHPTWGVLLSAVTGKDFGGGDITAAGVAKDMTMPLALREALQAAAIDNPNAAAAATILTMLGVSVGPDYNAPAYKRYEAVDKAASDMVIDPIRQKITGRKRPEGSFTERRDAEFMKKAQKALDAGTDRGATDSQRDTAMRFVTELGADGARDALRKAARNSGESIQTWDGNTQTTFGARLARLNKLVKMAEAGERPATDGADRRKREVGSALWRAVNADKDDDVRQKALALLAGMDEDDALDAFTAHAKSAGLKPVSWNGDKQTKYGRLRADLKRMIAEASKR